jgi:hypothetical protein
VKTIIAGSRELGIDSFVAAIECCPATPSITEVVSGTARGIDSIGESWARDNKIPLKQFPADWDTYGRSAGYIRNAEMADYADALIAIWDGKSRGTKHMIDIATKKGLEVFIYEDTNARH